MFDKPLVRSVPAAAIVALCLAVRPLATATPTPFTGVGHLVGVPVPGIFLTNALGQVSLKGNVHVLRVQADDPRITGRFQVGMDLAYQAAGTATFAGAAYFEVGTWGPETNNPTFTPNGGVWDMNYRGVAQADGSVQLNVAGYGVGGTIDGLRVEETVTRSAGVPFDPAIPYLGSGTIEPAPVDIVEVVDNFDDNKLTGWGTGGAGNSFFETNRQFTVRGKWSGFVTRAHLDTWAWPMLGQKWSVANGQTLECRVDLVSMSENATNAAGIVLWSDNFGGSYIFLKGRDFVQVGKWAGAGVAVFSHERAAIQNTNVVLSLALTRVDRNVTVTVRVLDKDNQEAVLYRHSVVDTPQVDRTLTSAELLAASGMNLSVFPDSGPPIALGNSILLNAFQYTDGQQPELEVTYDNLELRTHEVPLLGLERAVRLAWPASATIHYTLEGAPTAQGPWLPVPEVLMPGMNQMTVPSTDQNQFFRLREAP